MTSLTLIRGFCDTMHLPIFLCTHKVPYWKISNWISPLSVESTLGYSIGMIEYNALPIGQNWREIKFQNKNSNVLYNFLLYTFNSDFYYICQIFSRIHFQLPLIMIALFIMLSGDYRFLNFWLTSTASERIRIY